MLMRRPSTSTVHAPHCPRSQPFFVPVAAYSRSASSSVTRGSSCSVRAPVDVETHGLRRHRIAGAAGVDAAYDGGG